ncbi:MAG: hypothetical protein Q8M39_06300 [Sulfuricurvum sp.]|nr:hypothetical protein [Sulfuricurvum sp.]
MKSTSVDIPVHDIAPALEIHEYSIVWFLILTACLLAVSFIFFKKMRLRENSKEADARQQRYNRLIHIDMTDPKKAAYTICKEGSFFARDNEQMQSAYKTLFERLEPYKYASKVELIDEECLALYKAYCQMIIV